MKNTSKNLLKTTALLLICIIFIATPFSSVTHIETIDNYKSSQPTLAENIPQPSPGGIVTYPNNLSDHNNTADYLIITSDLFYNPAKQDHENETLDNRLNELAHWRAEYNGFDVAVVNVNDSFIGGNTDANIKEFIEYVYNNWSAPHMSDNHVGYILLVGDTPFVESHHLGNWVSDRWYGCIGDNDYATPDLMIGRFSVDNYTELDVITNKTIQYEKNWEPDDWHKKVLYAEGTSAPFFQYSFVKEILLELGGWEIFEVIETEGGTAADIVDNINDGRGIVVYCGHGWKECWEIFNSSDITQLNNGDKLPIVYSLACWTGSFHASDNCLGENFLNTPGRGAVAFFGASKFTLMTSNHFSKYIFTSMFENFTYIVGKIINEAIIQLYEQEGYIYPEFNLLGDPALDLSGSTEYPDRPDLALSHLNITISPETPTSEDEIATINTTVLNIGEGNAENVTVQFIVINQNGSDQHIISEQTISEIPPGSCSELIQLWNISEELGIKYFIVQIDPNGSIDEAFEFNNQAGIKVIIFIPGDLDRDGDVDLSDLATLLSSYNVDGGGDIDGDGDTDWDDLEILLEHYGTNIDIGDDDDGDNHQGDSGDS